MVDYRSTHLETSGLYELPAQPGNPFAIAGRKTHFNLRRDSR